MHKQIRFSRAACARETTRTSRPARLHKRIWFGRLGHVHERARISGLACRHRQARSLPQTRGRHFQVACIIAAASLSADVAFGHKLGICAFDRDEAHAEMFGEGTLGRETAASGDGPVLYIRANAEI